MSLRPLVMIRASNDPHPLAKELGRLELPAGVISDIETALRPKPQGKPPFELPEFPSTRVSDHNTIPGTATGQCAPELLVICGDSDSFDRRLRETLDHVKRCPETKRVIIVSTQWNRKVWRKHLDALRGMKAEVQPIFVPEDLPILLRW